MGYGREAWSWPAKTESTNENEYMHSVIFTALLVERLQNENEKKKETREEERVIWKIVGAMSNRSGVRC